jgi:hypothetical protein
MKNNVTTKTKDKSNEQVMNHPKTNHSVSSRLPVRMTLAALAVLASISVARASEDNRAPDLPSPLCDRVQVHGGRVAFHVNGASWVFVAPAARLFADAEYHAEVGTHYAGPTWESNSGGKVVASRVESCTPDPAAIAWLLLQKVSSEGPGIFDRVSFIQRVNTAGGLPPSGPGPFVGAEEEVPYTAEYYFYRDSTK